jgi:hypothetical protein
MSNQGLGQNQIHYYSQGDSMGRCPQCFGTDIEFVGNLSVNGTNHSTTNCKQCHRLFTGANGGIQSLMQEAQQQYNTQNVGFQSQMGIGQNLGQAGMQYQPPDNSYKFDQMNVHLMQLQTQFSQLAAEIIKLCEQNQQLMTKLATDPLVNIRKRVSDFNLE